MLQGLLLPIAIGAGIGGISAIARGESSRNVLKSMGLGALFAGVGGGLFRAAGLGGGAAANTMVPGTNLTQSQALNLGFGPASSGTGCLLYTF